MTPTFPYRFAVAMFDEGGVSLGTYVAQRDWEPVCEWTRFYYQRRGELPLDGDTSASVLPLWEDAPGEPYCRGYRVQLAPSGRQPMHADFPKSHFREFAKSVASLLIERKKLREGDHFTYTVIAYPAADSTAQTGGLQVANASPRIPVRDASLAGYLARSTPQGAAKWSDVPVFIAPRVLEEAESQTHAFQGTETGGIMIGSLWQDTQAGEIFVEITAQIPAEHTASSNTKLTFTANTWAAADAALRLRGRGEVFLGYWHSHPVREWCKSKACTLESQKNCRLARDFFSADDEAVMRAAFPRAYSVALVANDTAFADLSFSLFGNREGITTPRGFFILKENSHGA